MIQLNKFNILKYTIIYVVFTLLFLVFSYPYEIFILSKIHDFISKYNLPLDYSKIDSTPFKSTLYDVRITSKNRLNLHNINISYSPLSILTKKLNIKAANQTFTFNGAFKKNNFDYDITLNTSKIDIKDFIINGSITINGSINLKNNRGSFNMTSSPLKINLDKQVFNVGQLKGTANLQDNQISINRIESSGDLKLVADGKIFLNNSNIGLSSINIKCSIAYKDNVQNLYIRGTINKPAFYTR